MDNLSSSEWGEVYFSPMHNVVRDFFVPALKMSTHYDRATGYFTSSSLIELSVGICDLASRGGKIRVITSPRLYPEDVEAIKRGYDSSKIIGDAIVRDFEKPENLEALDRLALLSELISMGCMEIRIGIMKNLDEYPDAIFHPKFGIMTDDDGNKVLFRGSMNESMNGLGGNWDYVEVTSSSSKDSASITIFQNVFENIWENHDETVEVMDLPKVAEDLINSFKKDKSMLNLDKELLEKYAKKNSPKSVFFKSPDWLNNNKRQYQEDAIEKWIECGYNGIFNMATGTGKTKTALRALERLYNNHPDEGIFTIIIAPQKHLVDQWSDEIKEFGVNPIIAHSDASNGSWKEKFRHQMILYRNSPRNMCMVITISSFVSNEVQEWISKIDNLAIVADEAHNMGSASRLKKLPSNAKYRLALSATMDRFKDAMGTIKLREYFGEECIYFSLEDAIGKFLCNYNYYPIPCTYSETEYSQLVESNEHLDEILRSDVNEKVKKTAKKEYLEYSYTLNAKMESKFFILEEIMKPFVGKDHFLVYCGKVRTDDEGDFDNTSHSEFLRAIDKTSLILGTKGLGMKISRITYKEDAKERRRTIKEFNDGNTEGIIAISCLDEGVDIPSIKTAFIMSSSDNPREYIQRRGRVLRIHPSKDHADIYDFVVIPKSLSEVNPTGNHVGIELKMIAKEIKRIIEFSRVSLNPEESNLLLKDIANAYQTTVEEIIDIYGEEYDEQY